MEVDVTTALAQSSVFSSRGEERGGVTGYTGNTLKHKEHCNLGV